MDDKHREWRNTLRSAAGAVSVALALVGCAGADSGRYITVRMEPANLQNALNDARAQNYTVHATASNDLLLLEGESAYRFADRSGSFKRRSIANPGELELLLRGMGDGYAAVDPDTGKTMAYLFQKSTFIRYPAIKKPRLTTSISPCAARSAATDVRAVSGAAVELGQHKLAVAEGLGRGQAAVADPDGHVDQRVARLVESHFPAQQA